MWCIVGLEIKISLNSILEFFPQKVGVGNYLINRNYFNSISSIVYYEISWVEENKTLLLDILPHHLSKRLFLEDQLLTLQTSRVEYTS
jgi:hypothetical protein